MTYVDRWLLPDGVEELLPAAAEQIEQLRRRLLDLYGSWGYDLVIPPLLEYTDSLLIGLGRDVDLLTFKVTDQLSGRTMGIRADITPQTARMDAHSFSRQGLNRLCYAGQVVHTKPKSPLATRTPIQAGVELYGEPGLTADLETVSLLLESLTAAGVETLHIDLGHVGIYRALAEAADLSADQEQTFFELLQAKAVTEICAWVAEHIDDASMATLLLELPGLAGEREVLSRARDLLGAVPAAVAAVDELIELADVLIQRYPRAELYFDLSELRGYHYLTGIVFAAFVPGYGNAVASGGRYDHIGEVFGRARPATGFAVDLTALCSLGVLPEAGRAGIFAPASDNAGQWAAIQSLRGQGERVVCGLPGQAIYRDEINCDRQLLLNGDGSGDCAESYSVEPF